MKRLYQTLSLAEMLLRPALRDPSDHIFNIFFPAVFLLVYWIIGGKSLGQHVLFGSLIGAVVNSGIVGLPQIVVSYRYWKLQDMYVASPVNQVVYLLGHGLARLLYAIPSTLVLMGILLVTRFMPLRAVPITVLALLVGWATGCAVGFMLATYIHNATQVGSISSLAGLLMILVPPVFYPLELVSAKWRWLALVLPTTGASQLIKVASGASHLNSVGYMLSYWGSMALYFVGCFWLVVRRSRWREV